MSCLEATSPGRLDGGMREKTTDSTSEVQSTILDSANSRIGSTAVRSATERARHLFIALNVTI